MPCTSVRDCGRVSYTYVGETYAAVSESVPRALSMFYGSTERNFFKDQNLDIASLLQRPFNAGAAGGGTGPPNRA